MYSPASSPVGRYAHRGHYDPGTHTDPCPYDGARVGPEIRFIVP